MNSKELNECSLYLRLVGFRAVTSIGSLVITWHSPKHADVYTVTQRVDKSSILEREYPLEKTVTIKSLKQLKQYI